MFHVLLGHYWRGSRLGFNTTNAQEPWREPQTAVTRFQRRPQPARSATSASTNWSFGRADGPPNTHAPTPPRLMRVLTPLTNCPSTGVRQTMVGKDATSPCAQPVAAPPQTPGFEHAGNHHVLRRSMLGRGGLGPADTELNPAPVGQRKAGRTAGSVPGTPSTLRGRCSHGRSPMIRHRGARGKDGVRIFCPLGLIELYCSDGCSAQTDGRKTGAEHSCSDGRRARPPLAGASAPQPYRCSPAEASCSRPWPFSAASCLELGRKTALTGTALRCVN